MPVVFVHGVNNRKGPEYDAGLAVKTHFLTQCLRGATIEGKTLATVGQLAFPYWGDLATSFTWGMASLPRGDMQALSAGAEADLRPFLALVRDALPDRPAPAEPLLALAKRDFLQAVEVISALAVQHVSSGREAQVSDFVVKAQAYAAANPRPAWLAATTTDLVLLGNLMLAIAGAAGVQTQGLDAVLNMLSTTATRLKSAAAGMVGTAVDRAGDFASTKLLGWSRDGLNANLGRFFGDVFIYFATRGDKDAPGPIPQRILAAFEQAVARGPVDEPLVILGHSLGGVVSFDLLGHFRPDLEVDLFVTVGSQVAHFEEMKLYKTSDESVKPPAKAATPPNIKHWINVYDEVDIFSYACQPIFDRLDVDARYDTRTYVIKAHGAYFEQARFYERLRARIDAL